MKHIVQSLLLAAAIGAHSFAASPVFEAVTATTVTATTTLNAPASFTLPIGKVTGLSANVVTLLGAADYAAFKASLSLGNVENTALSTWVGSTNLVTLGGGATAGGVTLVTTTGTQTLTGKTLTAPAITSPTGLVKGDVGLGNVDNTSNATERAATRTLTNATISGASNTLTAIGNASLANSAITIGGTSVSLGSTIGTGMITGLTEDASPSAANDFVMTFDASATAFKKVKITNLGGGSTPNLATVLTEGADASVFTDPVAFGGVVTSARFGAISDFFDGDTFSFGNGLLVSAGNTVSIINGNLNVAGGTHTFSGDTPAFSLGLGSLTGDGTDVTSTGSFIFSGTTGLKFSSTGAKRAGLVTLSSGTASFQVPNHSGDTQLFLSRKSGTLPVGVLTWTTDGSGNFTITSTDTMDDGAVVYMAVEIAPFSP